MVPGWRPGVHARRLSNGHGHDSRPGLPLLRSRAAKIRSQHDLGVYGFNVHRHLSVVFLGLLARLLPHCDERVHWRFAQLWPYEDACGSESRLSTGAGVVVRLVSGVCDYFHLLVTYGMGEWVKADWEVFFRCNFAL